MKWHAFSRVLACTLLSCIKCMCESAYCIMLSAHVQLKIQTEEFCVWKGIFEDVSNEDLKKET